MHLLLAIILACLLNSCDTVEMPSARNVSCLGHRGHVTEDNFENSLDAFLSAYNIGAQGTELDVFHTKDGIPVVFHDSILRNLTTSKEGGFCPPDKSIGDFSLSQLHENCRLKNGDDIPLLEDVFILFAQTDFQIHIEFKGAASKKTVALLNKYYAGSYNKVRATFFYKDIGKSYRKTVALLPAGMDVLVTHKNYISQMEAFFSGVDVEAIFNVDIKRLLFAGYKVGVYNVDTENNLTEMIKLGVHYITTNELEKCLSIRNRVIENEK